MEKRTLEPEEPEKGGGGIGVVNGLAYGVALGKVCFVHWVDSLWNGLPLDKCE